MKRSAFLMVGVVFAATSCAPKYNPSAQTPVSSLSCSQLKTEYNQLMSIRSEAVSKSGFSKENVGWAILFWPGAVFNELDNRDVIDKVDARTSEIIKAGIARGCPVQ